MLILNDLVAKRLNKIFNGMIGTISHFFLMSFLYGLLITFSATVIMSGAVSWFSKEEELRIKNISIDELYGLIYNILPCCNY